MSGRSGVRRRLRAPRLRWPGVLALAAAAVVAVAPGASAHTVLRSASPAAGATVQGPVGSVVLTFGEPVAAPAFVAVTGPAGRADSGPARVRGAVVTVPLRADAPAGRYTVAYRVVSEDGHPVEASHTFRLLAATPSPSPSGPPPVTPPAPPAASPPATPAPAAAAGSADTGGDGSDHSGHWFMGFAGGAMVVAGAGALLYERRHRSDEDGET